MGDCSYLIKKILIEKYHQLNEGVNENTILMFLQKYIENSSWKNKIYLVGGAVRDEIMGNEIKDLDFLVDGDIDSAIVFSTELGKYLGVFKENSNPIIYPRFGTSKLSLRGNKFKLPNIELEFVSPRKETYDGISRKPEIVKGEIMDDVLRRDLTINSLLKNITSGEVIDMTGRGVNDIKNKKISTTNNPDVIFKEDPLRMLRAIRFTLKYEFEMDWSVLESIKKNAHLINNISKERIKDEFNKILILNNPSKGIEMLRISGLLKYILKDVDDMYGVEQNKYHKDDVYQHTLSVLDKTKPQIKNRLMGLFHDIGKILTKTITPDGSIHFYEHEKYGVDVVKRIMGELKYPNELINSVVLGVREHMSLKQGGNDGVKLTDKTLRKFKVRVGDNLEDILDLIHADNISHSDEYSMSEQINNVKERLKKLDVELSNNKAKLPIDGNDLKLLGLNPSPLYKEILSLIEDMFFENPKISKEDAVKFVKKYIKEKND